MSDEVESGGLVVAGMGGGEHNVQYRVALINYVKL